MSTCLLVNNDPEDQLLFVEAIDKIAPDTCVVLAQDSQEAIDLLIDGTVVPDYIITEFMTPGIDAMEFLRKGRVSEVLDDIPVIVHSPFPIRHRVRELLNMGAHALYLKPYTYVGICNMLNLFLKCFSVHPN